MKYIRTQIYLDPEEHRRLTAEAKAKGISLAALIREIAAGHTAERSALYDKKGWDSLIGSAGSGEPTDIARFKDQYLAEAMDQLYEKKMGRAPKQP